MTNECVISLMNPPTHPGVERVGRPWNPFSCFPFNEPETWLKTHGIVNDYFKNHGDIDFYTSSQLELESSKAFSRGHRCNLCDVPGCKALWQHILEKRPKSMEIHARSDKSMKSDKSMIDHSSQLGSSKAFSRGHRLELMRGPRL